MAVPRGCHSTGIKLHGGAAWKLWHVLLILAILIFNLFALFIKTIWEIGVSVEVAKTMWQAWMKTKGHFISKYCMI